MPASSVHSMSPRGLFGRRVRRRSVLGAALGLAVIGAAGLPAAAAAADLRPAWECLPENTAAVVRLPQPTAFLETLRAKTKFGAVLLTPRRIEMVRKLLDKSQPYLSLMGVAPDFLPLFEAGNRDDLETTLGTYGLKPADIEAIFKNEIGLAVVVEPRPEKQPPLVMTLVWVEPGADEAGRMLAAAKKSFEDGAKEGGDDGPRPRRIDLELAGHDVMWVIAPQASADLGGLIIDDVGEENDPAAARKKLEERLRDAPRTVIGHGHRAITRVGPRLVMANLQTPARSDAAGQPPESPGDEDAERDLDVARGILQRFLAAHAADGKPALADLLQSPGLRANLPAGQQLLDVVVEPQVVIRALAAAGGDETREALKRLKGIGLADIGPCGWRHAFAEGRYQSAMVVSLPAPRTGLMRILDLEPDTAEPPSFVTGDAVDFTQVSLDLGKAYGIVREYATAEFGDQASNLFAVGEANAQAVLGVDVQQVLSAFGSRHWTVNYPAKIAEAVAAGRQAGGVLAALGQANRGAMAWKVDDEPLILRILQRAAPLAGGELNEEQGFRGVRIPNGPAVFLGRDHLVVGVGAESLEKTLAAIRNPPAAGASFREGEAVRRARELQPLDPALAVTISDATKAGGIFGNLREIVAAMKPEDVAKDQPEELAKGLRELLAQAQQALPTAAEMEGLFGVGVDTIRMTEHGLVFRSVWELPAP